VLLQLHEPDDVEVSFPLLKGAAKLADDSGKDVVKVDMTALAILLISATLRFPDSAKRRASSTSRR